MPIQVKSINFTHADHSDCLTKPVEYTIAFGGVPTGIIKAQDAPRVDNHRKTKRWYIQGLCDRNKDWDDKAALAVFDVNSVKQTIKAATINAIT